MKETPAIMNTHCWILIGPSRYTTHFRCCKCGAEGIYGQRIEIPIETNENGSTIIGELPDPEFYDNYHYQNLTCDEIVIKNIVT